MKRSRITNHIFVGNFNQNSLNIKVYIMDSGDAIICDPHGSPICWWTAGTKLNKTLLSEFIDGKR